MSNKCCTKCNARRQIIKKNTVVFASGRIDSVTTVICSKCKNIKRFRASSNAPLIVNRR